MQFLMENKNENPKNDCIKHLYNAIISPQNDLPARRAWEPCGERIKTGGVMWCFSVNKAVKLGGDKQKLRHFS